MTAHPKPVKRARRPSTMPRKLVQLVIERDGGRCVHAGPSCTGAATVADHRVNRAMGGAAVLNCPSNLVAACVLCNGAKEDAHGEHREELIRRGIRVVPDSTHRKSLERARTTPVEYPGGGWFFLREDGRREPTEGPREEEEQHGDEV